MSTRCQAAASLMDVPKHITGSPGQKGHGPGMGHCFRKAALFSHHSCLLQHSSSLWLSSLFLPAGSADPPRTPPTLCTRTQSSSQPAAQTPDPIMCTRAILSPAWRNGTSIKAPPASTALNPPSCIQVLGTIVKDFLSCFFCFVSCKQMLQASPCFSPRLGAEAFNIPILGLPPGPILPANHSCKPELLLPLGRLGMYVLPQAVF